MKDGAAIKTTYGVNSAVRNIFKACGSTSSIAILPSKEFKDLFYESSLIGLILCATYVVWDKHIYRDIWILKDGAAIKTTYGVNSAVRNIFKACGSTSSIAILPSV
uniref:Uncharacterized protein n=1 Tax=Glossina palpalis gambiensis TaxID=67801 RepID=A0A1B0BGW9_9MUSC